MKISHLLNIKYPILQGAMANISTSELAGAVSEAGGLGMIATGGFSPDEVRNEIRKIKKMTDKPFGDIALEKALDGMSIEVHPGAQKYFDEVKK